MDSKMEECALPTLRVSKIDFDADHEERKVNYPLHQNYPTRFKKSDLCKWTEQGLQQQILADLLITGYVHQNTEEVYMVTNKCSV